MRSVRPPRSLHHPLARRTCLTCVAPSLLLAAVLLAHAGCGGGGAAGGQDGGSATDAGDNPLDLGGNGQADQGPTPSGAFLATQGIVVVEVESAARVDDWASETSVAGFSGGSYFRWDISAARTSSGGSGVLAYDVALTQAGRYQFHLRSAAPQPTDDNDAFARFIGADVVTVRNNAGATCPDGPAHERSPVADASGWFKVYQNVSGDSWTYTTHHHDNCAHRIFIAVPASGGYRVELSGRSRDFKLDRFVLRHVDANEALALEPSRPESQRAP